MPPRLAFSLGLKQKILENKSEIIGYQCIIGGKDGNGWHGYLKGNKFSRSKVICGSPLH